MLNAFFFLKTFKFLLFLTDGLRNVRFSFNVFATDTKYLQCCYLKNYKTKLLIHEVGGRKDSLIRNITKKLRLH